jgi:SAM-dependent methyltransferase
MTTPLALYGAALRSAATGGLPRLDVLGCDGAPLVHLHPSQWTGGLRPGDEGLVARCYGPTLDIGCGPGRLAAELTVRGRPTLGVDVSAEAIRLARERGVAVLRRSVFDQLPAEGGWRHVLLVDGNIGIGGDPCRLLRRCARLLDARGGLLAEVLPPGERTWAEKVVLRFGERRSRPFPWAGVAVTDLGRVAGAAALRIVDVWTEAGRWFGKLGRA